jgi:hypothetical protein
MDSSPVLFYANKNTWVTFFKKLLMSWDVDTIKIEEIFTGS